MLDKLFIPFERLGNATNYVVEGTGIGLALSKRLLDLMDSEIGVESRPAHGCTFYIDLPYINEQAHTSAADGNNAEVATEMAEQTRQYTVLYVEDNPPNLRLMCSAMQLRADIKLITAHTGTLGQEMAISHLPDLILLDINLPGINGLDILQKLKHGDKTRQIPIIAVTANAMPHDIEAGLKAGFDDYMVKPLDINRLQELLQHYLPRH